MNGHATHRTRRRFIIVTGVLLVVALTAMAYAHWPANRLPDGIQADWIIVDKSRRVLTLKSGDDVLSTYRVALGHNPIGPKRLQGDGRTPEGTYVVDWRNPKSGYCLSLHISYPDAQDRRHARGMGADPGGDIMIHGIKNGWGWIGRFHRLVDWTQGCIAVTNPEIREIWRVVPNGTPIEIRP